MAQERGDQFAQHAAAVARELLGEPNKHQSTKDELRFGGNGSKSVILKTGQFYDHEIEAGGGVLWAIETYAGAPVKGGGAVEWLRDHGYYIEERDDPGYANGHAVGSGADRKGSRLDPAGNWLPPSVPDHGRQTAVYDYREPDGALRYQVVRFDWDDESNAKGHSKTFLQRKPDASKKNGFTWKVKGTEPLPYRLPELLEDIADGAEIFIVEGEKKADLLRAQGVPATCNSGGAGKFPDDLVQWFKGAKVTILADNDDAGREHRGIVGNKLLPVAARVRVLDLPGLPPKGGVDDWLPAGGSAEELYRLAQQAPLFEPVPFVSKFQAVEWLDLDQPGPVYEELIKGVLTKNELSLLIGESQSGKSFLAIDIAASVARGVSWFGKKVIKGLVIYQAGESATGVQRKRLPAYRKHHNVAHEAIPFVLLRSPLDLYSSDDPTDAFIEECLHWQRRYSVPLELITIDTFNKATPGANENDGKDMGLVLARCDRIRKATGAHVMLVHHLNAGGTKARGHTSLFADVENVIACRVVPDHSDADGRKVREAVVAKQKDGEDGTTFRFVLPQVELYTDKDGDRVTSCIVAPPAGHAGEAPATPTATKLGGSHEVAIRALHDVLKDATAYEAAPAELNLPLGARVARHRDFSARFYVITKPEGFDEMDAAAKDTARATMRKNFERARNTLVTKAIIGINDDYVWLTGKPVMGFPPPPGVARRKKNEETGVEEDIPFADDDADLDAFTNS